MSKITKKKKNNNADFDDKSKGGRPRSVHYGEKWVAIKVLESTKTRFQLIKDNEEKLLKSKKSWNDVVHEVLNLREIVRDIIWEDLSKEEKEAIKDKNMITTKDIIRILQPREKNDKPKSNQGSIYDYNQNGDE